MFGTTRDTNGRTGTQKLLTGVTVALAVLVVSSMVIGMASAKPPKRDKDSSVAKQDLQPTTPNVADGEDVLESGDDNWQTTWDGDYPMTALDGDCSGDLDGVETCGVTKPIVIVRM